MMNKLNVLGEHLSTFKFILLTKYLSDEAHEFGADAGVFTEGAQD